MYEKHGLMSKIRNPLVLAYLRSNEESNTKLIENALWEKLGLSQKKEESKCRRLRRRCSKAIL